MFADLCYFSIRSVQVSKLLQFANFFSLFSLKDTIFLFGNVIFLTSGLKLLVTAYICVPCITLPCVGLPGSSCISYGEPC